MTEIELRFMQTVPSRLKGIEEQLERIANALEKQVGTSNKPSKDETV